MRNAKLAQGKEVQHAIELLHCTVCPVAQEARSRRRVRREEARLPQAELIALLPGDLERRLSHTEALQELIASREALQKEFDMQLVEQSPRQCRTAE